VNIEYLGVTMEIVVKRRGNQTVVDISSSLLERHIRMTIRVPTEYLDELASSHEHSSIERYVFTEKEEFIRGVLFLVATLGVEDRADEVLKIVKNIPDQDFYFWIRKIMEVPRIRSRQRLMKIGRAIRILYSQ
jgi:hypothetical protein